MDLWIIGNVILLIAALFTSVQIAAAAYKKISLHEGGSGFEDSNKFSKEARGELIQHYSRIQGTLIFWKNQATLYERLYKYAVVWSIVSAVLIPVLIQVFDPTNIWSRIFMTVLSISTGLLIALSRGFKSEELFRAFRTSESDFYDLRRRLLDLPDNFGKSEQEILDNYFKQVAKIRKAARDAELNNPPSASPL